MKNEYKQVFVLPKAESDFVCAVCHWMKSQDGKQIEPEEVIAAMVRSYARHLGDELKEIIWNQAKSDGRGPWK